MTTRSVNKTVKKPVVKKTTGNVRKSTAPAKKSKYSSSYEDSGDAEFDDFDLPEDEDDDLYDDFEEIDDEDDFSDLVLDEEVKEKEEEKHYKEMKADPDAEERYGRMVKNRYDKNKRNKAKPKKVKKKNQQTLDSIEKKLGNPYEGLNGKKLEEKLIKDAAKEIAKRENEKLEKEREKSKSKSKNGKAVSKKDNLNRDVTEHQKLDYKKLRKMKVPKTVQESIPYVNVYPNNGIIEIEEGVFTKTYMFKDVSFKIETQDKQEEIFYLYGELINTFGSDVGVEMTIRNRTIDKDMYMKRIKMPLAFDDLDVYREEMNHILSDKIDEGKNGVVKDRYITLTIIAEDIKEASIQFSRLDTALSSTIKKITKTSPKILSTNERLSMLYDIYNPDAETGLLNEKKNKDGTISRVFDLMAIKKMGLSTKDIIAPESLTFNSDHFTMGEKFGRALFLKEVPSYLSCEVVPDIADCQCDMLTSVYFNSIRQDKALKMLKNQLVNISSNVVDAQKRASRAGFSADLISPELMHAQNEARGLMEDLTTRNQKLYLVTLCVVHFADTLEQLDKDTRQIQTSVAKHICELRALSWQQEVGLNAALPLGCNKLQQTRLLTTESASVFMPFSAEELNDSHGFYYGLNAVSKNLIIYDRTRGTNCNGVILGVPGGGKSFSAKREIISVLLGTKDEVYVIDPEREYTPLAALLGGEVIKIAVGSPNHINPFDMDLNYGDDEGNSGDPVSLKSDFIGSLCETIIGGKFGLSPIQKSIIDRCVRSLYEEYLFYLQHNEDKITSDTSRVPTLKDFYYLLRQQPEPEAQDIAVSMEIYTEGSLDTFSYKTNVKTKARFVVYDIKDIGAGLKELGLQVCLDNIWNKIISNKDKGVRTWFYIDEFYLLTQTESSASYLRQIWKRARKWKGVPTGITQNVEDLLASKEGRGIINNCEMVIMLKQSPIDRETLSNMFNISAAQQQYITNSEAGQGLLYNGQTIIPFEDKFPQDTELYKAITTKPDDVDISKIEVKAVPEDEDGEEKPRKKVKKIVRKVKRPVGQTPRS